MSNSPVGLLLVALVLLIFLSAFFSAAEIGMMTLNRYRLRHLAESGHRGARIASKLLERPDRLLGIMLLGNNFANIAASSIATVLAIELYGQKAIAVTAGILTFIILVFAEVAPKTLAALQPERIAFIAAYALQPLLKLAYPLVWLVNIIANRLLRVFGVPLRKNKDQLSSEELKTAVIEAGSLIPESHQSMLLGILDLEKITVEDVMVPRGEIDSIDLDTDWDEIISQLAGSRYTRIPVYRGTIDNIVGLIHVRQVLHLCLNGNLNRESLNKIIAEPYFIPQGTSLNQQLVNFKERKRRIGQVVDEYGDLMGIVTLEDIIEEIIGDFTTQNLGANEEIYPQKDGSFLINGSANIRDLNRKLGWHLPTDGPKTLNGVIVEYLEDIPAVGTSLLLGDYLVEIMRTRGTAIQIAHIRPNPKIKPPKE